MEFRRWTSFAVLTSSLTVQAYALGQELNGQPTVPADIGTIVVEEAGKTEEKPVGEASNDVSGVLFFDYGTVGPIPVQLNGASSIRGFNFTSNADPESLPKFVIGVSLTEVPDSLRAHIKLAAGAGIMVGAVVPESPAAKAGLQQYDILLKAGDKDLTQPKVLQDLVDAAETKPISITLQRAGELQTLEVTPIGRGELKMVAPLAVDLPPGFGQTPGNSASWLHILNGQLNPAPLNMNSFPPGFSPASPQSESAPPVEALTDSIRKLTEQIERLQQAVDRLEKKPDHKENENHGYRTRERNPNEGDCLKTPRRNSLTTLISLS